MTASVHTAIVAPVHAEFMARAASLGARCWCFDAALNLVAQSAPDDSAIGESIIPLSELTGAASCCLKKFRVETVAASDGGELHGFPARNGAVVLAFAEAVFDARVRDQVIQTLQHYHSDLMRLNTSEQAIDGFNAQLSQSYEEVNLIFSLSKLLNQRVDPRLAVQKMCDEVRAVLLYGWCAVLLDESDSTLMPLRGISVEAGALPMSPIELRSEVSHFLHRSELRVLEPAKSSLAKRAGSEVLCQRIMHGPVSIGVFLAGGRQGAESDVVSNELQLVQATVGFLELFHENAFRFDAQRLQFLGTLHALSAAVDAKDPYTHGHSQRVGLLASKLAERLGFDADQVEATRIAGRLHDIGKIGIPDAILTKPAKLTDAEFEIIKQHPVLGHQMLQKIPSLEFQLAGVLHHHERWDGRGYPHQLAGEQIPMIARILGFADTFDAMSSNRAYRPALDRCKVMDEIRRSSGSQFDPALVDAFTTLDFSDFDALLEHAKVRTLSVAA